MQPPAKSGSDRSREVIERLIRLCMDLQGQITELESGFFRVIFVTDNPPTRIDCTFEQVGLLRQGVDEIAAVLKLLHAEGAAAAGGSEQAKGPSAEATSSRPERDQSSG